MNDLDIWLNNTYFKKHLDNAQDKDRIISQLEKATELGKINWLLDAFPKTLDDEEIYSSLFLNISTDYSKSLQNIRQSLEWQNQKIVFMSDTLIKWVFIMMVEYLSILIILMQE